MSTKENPLGIHGADLPAKTSTWMLVLAKFRALSHEKCRHGCVSWPDFAQKAEKVSTWMLVLAKKSKTSTGQNCNPRIQKGPPLEKVTTPSLFGLVSHLARFRRWLTQQASANGCPASRSAENAAKPPRLRPATQRASPCPPRTLRQEQRHPRRPWRLRHPHQAEQRLG